MNPDERSQLTEWVRVAIEAQGRATAAEAESTSLRQRLATAERHKAELMERNANLHAAKEHALADATALRGQSYGRREVHLVGPGIEPVRAFLTDLEEAWIHMLFERKVAAERGRDEARERVTKAEALLGRLVTLDGESVLTQFGDVTFLASAAVVAQDARAFLSPTEPDVAARGDK